MSGINDTQENSYSPAKTVQKAFAVLEALGEKQPLNASDLADHLGLSRSNVHRLLSTLSRLGYVERGAGSTFRLGAKVFILGSNFSKSNDLSDLAYPFMKQLAEASQENVNLGVIYEQKVLYLNKIKSSHYLKLDTPIGKMDPLYCTGLGKVLLSGLSDGELEHYLATTDFRPYTPKTVTDPKMLTELIKKVKRQGFAVDFEELDRGVHCIAAPIWDHRNRIVAAMSISAPSVRLTPSKIKNLRPQLVAACSAVSIKLGYEEN